MNQFFAIPNFPNYYINKLGEVRSNKRKKEIILKPSKTTKGYYQVVLWRNKPKTVTIHYLMGITFLNLKRNEIIDHIDNIKTNNKLENLRVSNYRENTGKDANNKYSKLQGVSYYKKTNKYVANIRIKGKLKYLGTFNTDLEAHEKYKQELKKLIE